ncbi:Uncharacterised protein [Bordetella pertussis]|nr:Uncharacterised protein [Bordetella pertussis]
MAGRARRACATCWKSGWRFAPIRWCAARAIAWTRCSTASMCWKGAWWSTSMSTRSSRPFARPRSRAPR